MRQCLSSCLFRGRYSRCRMRVNGKVSSRVGNVCACVPDRARTVSSLVMCHKTTIAVYHKTMKHEFKLRRILSTSEKHDLRFIPRPCSGPPSSSVLLVGNSAWWWWWSGWCKPTTRRRCPDSASSTTPEQRLELGFFALPFLPRPR